MKTKPELSIVIPFYNEISSIQTLLARTALTMKRCQIENYEVLIVDNGSTHVEAKALLEHGSDHHTRVIVLSRNFGYQGALWAGLDFAKADTVVFMDADGEDPPEMIEHFLLKAKEGYQVVYGIRTSREVNWFLLQCYKKFYRILSRFASIDIPLDAGEFSLVTGKALVALRSFQDRTRMMRILRAWVEYRQTGIPYHRNARIAGKSKFNFLSAVRFAFDGFVAATDIPVRLSIYSAIGCFFAGILGSIYYVFWHFFGEEKIPGFASLNITLLFLFSMLFICFSVLARYVITLLDETRRRPPYLIVDEYSHPE